jgi:MFS family permease
MNIEEEYQKNIETDNQMISKVDIAKNIPKTYAVNFASSLHFISPVLVLFFTEWGGITLQQTLILQSWFMGWMFLMEIPTGTVADYFGRKISLVLSQVILIIAILIYSSVPVFSMFMLGEFLFALAITLSSGANEAFIYDTLKEIGQEAESEKIFGRFRSSGLIGILSGSLLGSLIAVTFGVRYCFLFMVFPTMISLIISFTLKEPLRHENGKQKKQNMLQILKESSKYFLKTENRAVQILTIDSIIISVISYFIIWLWQTKLSVIGVNIAFFGIINFGMLLGQIVLLNTTVYLKKLLRSKKAVISLTALLTGIGFLLVGSFMGMIPVIIGVIIAATFGMSRRTLLLNYINKYIPSEQRATIISAVAMFRQFILMILIPIVGIFVDMSLNTVLVILGIIAVIWSLISPVKEKYLIN